VQARRTGPACADSPSSEHPRPPTSARYVVTALGSGVLRRRSTRLARRMPVLSWRRSGRAWPAGLRRPAGHPDLTLFLDLMVDSRARPAGIRRSTSARLLRVRVHGWASLREPRTGGGDTASRSSNKQPKNNIYQQAQ
jgi:hypothetical protein